MLRALSKRPFFYGISALFGVCAFLLSASAASATPGDSGVKDENKSKATGDDDEQQPFWADSSVSWTQSASGDTVGLGQDYQSQNPTYDWSFSLSPVFALYKTKPFSVSLSGDISTYREFTNSDGTTRRGEWDFGDIQAGAGLSLLLYEEGLYRTSLGLRLPTLSFPTSKSSANNGKRLGLGSSLSLSQSFPLAGKEADAFKSFSVSGSAGYSHTFTEAVVPTNSGIQRIRLTPDGQALPSDQLGSSAFANHRASFTLSVGTAVTDRVSLDTGFTWSPVWKYTFDNSVEVCSLATGCVRPDRVNNPQNLNVIAGFTADVGVQVFDAMNLSAGYSNVTLQLGPDAKRRQPFYSPAARVSLSVSSSLDELYKLVKGGARATPAPRSNVASR